MFVAYLHTAGFFLSKVKPSGQVQWYDPSVFSQAATSPQEFFFWHSSLSVRRTYSMYQESSNPSKVRLLIVTHHNSSFHRPFCSRSLLHNCSNKIPECSYKRSLNRRYSCPHCTHSSLQDEERWHEIISNSLILNTLLLTSFYLTGSEKSL